MSPTATKRPPLSPSPGCAEVAKFPRNPWQNRDQQHKAPQAAGRDPLRALQGTKFTPNPASDVLGSTQRSGRAVVGPMAGSVPLPRCGGEQKGQNPPVAMGTPGFTNQARSYLCLRRSHLLIKSSARVPRSPPAQRQPQIPRRSPEIASDSGCLGAQLSPSTIPNCCD